MRTDKGDYHSAGLCGCKGSAQIVKATTRGQLSVWKLAFRPPLVALKPWLQGNFHLLRKPRRLTFLHRNQVRPTGFCEPNLIPVLWKKVSLCGVRRCAWIPLRILTWNNGQIAIDTINHQTWGGSDFLWFFKHKHDKCLVTLSMLSQWICLGQAWNGFLQLHPNLAWRMNLSESAMNPMWVNKMFHSTFCCPHQLEKYHDSHTVWEAGLLHYCICILVIPVEVNYSLFREATGTHVYTETYLGHCIAKGQCRFPAGCRGSSKQGTVAYAVSTKVWWNHHYDFTSWISLRARGIRCTLRKKCWIDAEFLHIQRFWHFPHRLEVGNSPHNSR